MQCEFPALVVTFVGMLTACSSSSGGVTPAGNGAVMDGSTGASGDDADTTRDAGAAGFGGGVDGSGGQDATVDGAVPRLSDSGLPLGSDGGPIQLMGTGSCCAQQTTPGCDNADLEVCVCEKDETCCTTAWGPQCVFIVQQKYCQTGIRDCVCGADVDAGQWDQTQCCDTEWTSTCDSVATIKCGAVQGCF